MKRLLTSIALIIALTSIGQIQDTTIKYCTAAKVEKFPYKNGLPQSVDTITHVGVYNYNATDSTCSVYYSVISSNPTRNILFGWHDLTANDMFFWDRTLLGLTPFIANKFGLTLK